MISIKFEKGLPFAYEKGAYWIICIIQTQNVFNSVTCETKKVICTTNIYNDNF